MTHLILSKWQCGINCHLFFFTRCEEHLDIDSIFQPTMDDRLKGNSLMVLNEDLENTPNSDGSQLSKQSTADQQLSTLMEQGKAMVALLQMNRRKRQMNDNNIIN